MPETTQPQDSKGFAQGSIHRVLTGYYRPPEPVRSYTTQVLTADRLYLTRITVEEPQTWDRVAVETTAASGAGTAVRVGLYFSAASGMTPAGAPLIADWGEIATDANAIDTATIDYTAKVGVYWLAMYAESTPTVRAFRPAWPLAGHLTAWSDDYAGYYYSGSYGALASTCPATTGLTYNPQVLVCMRIASYP